MKKVIILGLAVVITMATDPAAEQLPNFKKKSRGHIKILTNKNGSPVEVKDTTSLNGDLLDSESFMETLSHQLYERIPDRVVHHKGTGAFGYFEVTHNISDICRASLFESNGKKTPVAVRFSLANGKKGGPDTVSNIIGIAIKFYTDEGNFDLILFHIPLFIFNDPQLFPFEVHSVRQNPQTNLNDENMMWDFVANTPEVLPSVLYQFGDDGTPDGFRYIPGFSVHTYQVYNKFGESYFVRFHFYPDGGIRNLCPKKAKELSCSDPDYSGRDMFNAIEKGEYPSWTLKLQVLSREDLKNCDINPFDMTKVLPESKYPLRTVGKLILNRNPANYFADVEQSAFCPSNLVRGILGAPDHVFKARRFSYKAAQRYRLGVNFQNIDVNKPLAKVFKYERDGRASVGSNGEDSPNYYRNSFNGPVPYVDKNQPKLINVKPYVKPFDFKQVTERYNDMSKDQRKRLIENIVESLHKAEKFIQQKILALFKSVHKELALNTIVALTESNEQS